MKFFNLLTTSFLFTLTLSQQDTISHQCVTLCKQFGAESATDLRQCTFECLQVVNRLPQPNNVNSNSATVVPTLQTSSVGDSTFTVSSVVPQASESMSSGERSLHHSRSRSSDEALSSNASNSDSMSASMSASVTNSASSAAPSSNLKSGSSSKSASKSKSASDSESSAMRITGSLAVVVAAALFNLL